MTLSHQRQPASATQQGWQAGNHGRRHGHGQTHLESSGRRRAGASLSLLVSWVSRWQASGSESQDSLKQSRDSDTDSQGTCQLNLAKAHSAAGATGSAAGTVRAQSRAESDCGCCCLRVSDLDSKPAQAATAGISKFPCAKFAYWWHCLHKLHNLHIFCNFFANLHILHIGLNAYGIF